MCINNIVHIFAKFFVQGVRSQETVHTVHTQSCSMWIWYIRKDPSNVSYDVSDRYSAVLRDLQFSVQSIYATNINHTQTDCMISGVL
jgi:hypothetical protein